MNAVLSIKNLRVSFETSNGKIRALNGVTMEINEGETFGIVGESGCGKSVTSLAIMGLLPKNAHIESGEIIYRGRDLLQLNDEALSNIRSSQIAIVFQDPSSSLDPLFKIEDQVAEPLLYSETKCLNKGRSPSSKPPKNSIHKKVIELLELVRVPDAERVARSYPHQLSGGLKQRVMIAIALALNPTILVLDEPTTALDVTIQDEILSMLKELRARLRMTILLITHDFGIVAEMCHRVAVMYAGTVVEISDVSTLLTSPKHPYTQALLKSVPTLRSQVDDIATIAGVVPSLKTLPPGCIFQERCPVSMQVCVEIDPDSCFLNGGHMVKCHLYNQSSIDLEQ